MLIPVFLLPPAHAASQGRGVELGAGLVGLGFTFAEETTFSTNVSEGFISAAFYVSEYAAFEPRLSGALTSTSGIRTAQAVVDPGFPTHFRPTVGRRGLYFRPALGVQIVGGTRVDGPLLQFGPGLGIGGKVPLDSRLSLRLETVFRRYIPTDDVRGRSQLTALVGGSFFTR